MLKSKAKWEFNPNTVDDESVSIIETLIQNKGIYTVEDKQRFLHPSLDHLTSPALLDGIEQANSRIKQAIEQDEYIVVYGDYDADGVTSTALLMQVFMDLGANCDFYIPNRFQEGYGLNTAAIRKIKEAGASLMITVDNGIANVAEVEFANSIGLDVIITDHHEIQEEIPDAYAIIHPKQSDKYPFKDLAGVGVAFQLAYYLLDELPMYLLDYVAIGTIADLVPLQGDNRILVSCGLKVLNETTNLGLLALKETCNLSSGEILDEKDVGFKIAPRLNAVGRLQNASLAVELLLTIDPDEAKDIALKIETLNTERKGIVENIVKEAKERVRLEEGIIMLYDASWHEGVLGIAASRLVRMFDRPVILLTYKEETNILKGSARSIPAFHLFQEGMKIKHLFTQFGGHSQAAGMSLPIENFEMIKQTFNQVIAEQLKADDFKQVIQHIQRIEIHDMTETFVEQLQMLAPFGMGNEEPVFHFKGVPTQIRQLGQHQQHLKLQFREGPNAFDVIGFQFGSLFYYISQDVEVSVVGKLQINEWNGNKMVQMLLEDIAVDTWQLYDYRAKNQEKMITPYLNKKEKIVLLGHSMEYLQQLAGENHQTMLMTYSDHDLKNIEADLLIICDLPSNLNVLKEILQQLQPSNIHVSYHVTEDAFLNTVPQREEFKWLYGYLHTYEPIQLKVDLIKIIKQKKWSKEKIIFMLKVFIDLKFIRVEDNIIYINRQVEKTPLNKSTTYQYRLQQADIEKTLYYSTYDELKEWFEPYIKQDALNREEVTNES